MKRVGPANRIGLKNLAFERGLLTGARMLALGERGFADSDIRALRRYLSRILKNSADVEDAIQDAYLRVLEYADDGPRIDNPMAFLHRIAGNLAIDNVRRRRRTSLVCTARGDSEEVEERAQNVCSPHDAEDSLQHDQIIQAVFAALGVALIYVPEVMAWTPLLGTASNVPKWKCGNHLNREGHPDEHYDGRGRFGKDSLSGARRR